MVEAPFLPSLRALVRCYQAFSTRSAAHLRTLGLTPPQFDIVATLGNTPGMTPKELGEKTLITKGTLTGVVDRLEEKGLIRRIPSALDGRSQIVKRASACSTRYSRRMWRISAALSRIGKRKTTPASKPPCMTCAPFSSQVESSNKPRRRAVHPYRLLPSNWRKNMSQTPDSNITLFSSIQLGPYALKNRMVMAPMTRNRAGAGNAPQPLNVEYYVQRASAGLIITEGSQVAAEAVGYPATPGIHSAEQVAGWKKITDAVHAQGGRIFLQLWHCGRISHPSLLPGGMLPVAPSAIKPSGQAVTPEGMKPFETPHTLALSGIPGIIEQFRSGARNALDAGFDGVEIHGANGYLPDQFLRDGSNQRSDAYGGSIANRARLMLEVVDAVCGVWSANRVGIRLSPLQPFNDMRDSNPEATFAYIVEQLNRFGLAYLHVTEMGKESPGAAGPAFDLQKLRTIWQGVYMTNGGYDLARGNAALALGFADMIAFGVPFLANPDLPARYAKSAPLNEPDPATFYGGAEQGYTDYPFLLA